MVIFRVCQCVPSIDKRSTLRTIVGISMVDQQWPMLVQRWVIHHPLPVLNSWSDSRRLTLCGSTATRHSFSRIVSSLVSSANIFLTFRDSSWIFDSSISSHMTNAKSFFQNLSPSIFHSVVITDGRSCFVSREEVVQPSSQLKLSDVLLILEFSVNLLFISVITKHLNCNVTFFPFHCIFQNLLKGKRISLGHNLANRMYMLMHDEIPHGLTASVSAPSHYSYSTTDWIILLLVIFNKLCLKFGLSHFNVSHGTWVSIIMIPLNILLQCLVSHHLILFIVMFGDLLKQHLFPVFVSMLCLLMIFYDCHGYNC